MKAIFTRMCVVIATLVVSPWRDTSNTSVPILEPLRMMSNTRWTCLGAAGAAAWAGRNRGAGPVRRTADAARVASAEAATDIFIGTLWIVVDRGPIATKSVAFVDEPRVGGRRRRSAVRGPTMPPTW